MNCADYDAAGLEVELFGSERFDGHTQTTTQIGRVEQCAEACSCSTASNC